MQGKLWVLRLVSGDAFGPFTTEQISNLTDDGYLTGEEELSEFPVTKWQRISKVPFFYDGFLKVLEKGVRPRPLPERMFRLQEFTQHNRDKLKKSAAQEEEKKSPSSGAARPGKKKSTVEIVQDEKKASAAASAAVIDLVENKPGPNNLKKYAAPALLVFGVALVLGLWFSDNSGNLPKGKIRLIAPLKQTKNQISEDALKKRMQTAVDFFQRDTFRNYLKAEETLVQLVEDAPRSAEALALLCLSYRELWPYTDQGQADLSVVIKVVQMAGRVDAVGTNGSVCRAVQQIISGRMQEALGIADSVLVREPTAAVFYEIKAQVYAEKRDFNLAVSYLQKTQQLWPEWLKSFSAEGLFRQQALMYTDAATVFRNVLRRYPKHIESRLRLGILEFSKFQQKEKAVELLKGALQANDRAPDPLMGEAQMNLALIEEARGNRAEALRLATAAYHAAPTTAGLKELIVRTGGQKALNEIAISDQESIALAEQYFKTGNYLAAQAHFKTAFEENPKNGRAALRAAEALWALNQGVEAIGWMNKALKADQRMVNGWLKLADWYSQRYEFSSAAAVVQKAQRLEPKNHEVQRAFAQLSLRRNDIRNAIASAEAALRGYDTDIEAHLILVEAYRQKRAYSEAYNWASRAIAIEEGNSAAQSAYAESLAELQGGRAAAQYIGKLIGSYPSVLGYRITLAKILLRDESFGEAEKVLRDVIEAAPEHKEALMLLGDTLAGAGKQDDALNAFLSAAALDPSDATPVFRMGQLYIKFGKAQPAITQFERVLSVNPSYPLTHYAIGRAALLAGDADRALKEAALEKRINPNISDSFLLAGDALMEGKAYSRATQEYQAAVQRRPQGSDVYVKLARAYRLSNSPDTAIQMLRMAAARESGNPEIYKEQGAVFETKGEVDKALRSYRQYLQLLPNAPDRSSIEQRMQNLGG